jgi:hypothetical protein
VAEEVNLDQQSDDTRRVGQLPGIASDALDTVPTESENKGTP